MAVGATKATRAARNARRNATKRTILGALDENGDGRGEAAKGGASCPDAPSSSSSSSPSGAPPKSGGVGGVRNRPQSSLGAGGIELPSEVDGTNADTIRLILDDLERETRRRMEAISVLADQAASEQQEFAFLNKMKIGRAVRGMTIGEFNEKFGCDIVAEVKGVMDAEEGGDGAVPGVGKKRDRPPLVMKGGARGAMDLETPAPKARTGRFVAPTPGTVMRTVRRGEAVFSQNGSPVDHAEEGDLVATVFKKRRGVDGTTVNGEQGRSAVFDISVGHGRYINLADPSTVQHLDEEMKNTAKSQLKKLQDQMASLMAQLGN